MRIIANRHGKIFLPFFLPYASVKAVFLMRKFDVFILGDGVMATCWIFGKTILQKEKESCLRCPWT